MKTKDTMLEQVHVYAGTAGHSAWFSDDSGDSWVHPNSHSGMYLEARVWAFASHPATPDRLYAGTDMGAYQWDETSARWIRLSSPMEDVWALAIDPSDPNLIIAGTRPAAFYRSADAGQTWVKLDAPGVGQFSEVNMGPTRVTQILFDPTSPDTIWATIEIGGIYRSVDRGDSWQPRDGGLVSSDVHGIAILRGPDGSSNMLASTNRGLHRSVDRGETWSFERLESPWQYTRAVVPRADDDAIVFLANGNGPPGNTGRLLRSRDYGRTWEDAQLPAPVNSTPWCIATSAQEPLVVFVCTNLGQLFRSSDGGETWLRLEQEFGELRALHWRGIPRGMRRDAHSVTRPMVKAAPATQALSDPE